MLVRDYVLNEVLANEAPEVIDVLSAAAVVPRVNPSLAQALTDRPDAGELLRTAEARGLFVTRRGVDGWFELHALVRGVLTADLASRSPNRLAELHTRAARWFEDADEVVVALDQWLLADRPRDALRLLSASQVQLYDSGREATVKRTIAAIPTAVAVSDLDSMLDYAWCHLLVDRRRFIELVEQLTWWVDRSSPTTTPSALRVNVVRAAAANVGGRWVESGALSRQVLLDLGESCWQDPLGRFAANGVARELALSECWDDASDEVRQAEVALSRDPERRLAFEGTRALGQALAGRPLDALRVAAGVRRAAPVADMTIMRAELAVAEALAHRELGDRPRAMAELTALADTPAETMLFCRVLAMCELAQAHLDEGDLDTARQVFAETEALVEAESLGADVRGWLTRVGTVLALAGGDARGRPSLGRSGRRLVLGWGQRRPSAPRRRRPSRRDGGPGHRGATLRPPRSRPGTPHGACGRRSRRGDEVRGHGRRARLRQRPRCRRWPWKAPRSSSWSSRPLGAPRRSGSTACDDPRRRHGISRRPPVPALIEPLTERERDVLRFLPSRLTVREIADELYISVNTLKFHLRAIYRKLGVNSRAEAAEVARTMTELRR